MFKKYSQMKLRMKREVLQKLNRMANENFNTDKSNQWILSRFCHGCVGFLSFCTSSRSAASSEVV